MSFNTSTGVLSGDFGDNATYTMTGTTTPASSARTFTITVAEDVSIAAYSNLRIWLRGGYNGRSAGAMDDGDTIQFGTATNTNDFRVKNAATYVAYNETAHATTSLGASGSGIRDAKGGSSAALQDDLLYYNSPADTKIFIFLLNCIIQ